MLSVRLNTHAHTDSVFYSQGQNVSNLSNVLIVICIYKTCLSHMNIHVVINTCTICTNTHAEGQQERGAQTNIREKLSFGG